MSRNPKKGRLPEDRNRPHRNSDAKSRASLVNWLIAAALVAAVFLAYQPAWHGGYLWDDDTHLKNNPVFRPGGWLRTWAARRLSRLPQLLAVDRHGRIGSSLKYGERTRSATT